MSLWFWGELVPAEVFLLIYCVFDRCFVTNYG